MTRQCIRCPIIQTRAVDNAVLEAQQFGENSLLPMSMQPLIDELGQAFLIGKDHKLLKLQVRTPQLYSKQDGHEFFFIC